MWERWRKGESLQQIAQLFDRNHSSISGFWLRPVASVQPHGALPIGADAVGTRGDLPWGGRGSLDALDSCAIGRAPSTVSREIRRNGGQESYRASEADQAAWDQARRPKRCKLAQNRALARIVAEAPTAVVTGTDRRLAEAHVSGRCELPGVTRDHLSQPVHPGPRGLEKGAGGSICGATGRCAVRAITPRRRTITAGSPTRSRSASAGHRRGPGRARSLGRRSDLRQQQQPNRHPGGAQTRYVMLAKVAARIPRP